MAPATVAVKPVNGPDFRKGVANAKKMGGRFDGAAKVWIISADRPELRALTAYSLTLVKPVAHCHYTADQGCVLHGEFCPSNSSYDVRV